MSLRYSRSGGTGVLAAALVTLAVGFAGAAPASADVCTGGAPYEATGAPESQVTGLVAFLSSPRWSREMLPGWDAENGSTSFGNQLAYAWYRDTRLWGATSTASWWVVPGVGCDLKNESEHTGTVRYGEGYAPEVCVLVFVALSLESADCEDAMQLAAGSPPVELESAGQRLLSGFASPGTGSVEVRFQNGSATFPAVGGVYGGSVQASIGKALGATDLQTAVTRTPAPVALVDQTGISTQFLGSLASGPRMKKVAARIHARIPSVRAVNLGDSVTGQRAHDGVLYAPGSRALAARVARALGAPAAGPLTVAAAKMFGPVAQVVVLVGRTD